MAIRLSESIRGKRWQDWLALALGLWLLISPWLLGFSDVGVAAWNAVLVGVGIALFAAAALAKPADWQEWVALAFGVWLVISPWLLGFGEQHAVAAWHQVIVGLLVGIDALWAVASSENRRVFG